MVRIIFLKSSASQYGTMTIPIQVGLGIGTDVNPLNKKQFCVSSQQKHLINIAYNKFYQNTLNLIFVFDISLQFSITNKI
jgi:hypothetical protein